LTLVGEERRKILKVIEDGVATRPVMQTLMLSELQQG
jgi:hypothetical protein